MEASEKTTMFEDGVSKADGHSTMEHDLLSSTRIFIYK